MNLTEEQLFDYIKCPAMYDLKHERKIIINQEQSITKILENTSKYFYTQLMLDKKTPSMKMLTNKYEALYKKSGLALSEKKYNEGLLALRNFYNWACSNKIAVIDSSLAYSLVHKDVSLSGVLSPIAVNRTNGITQLEFLIVNFSNRNLDQLTLDTKLKYSIDILAFNNSNPETKITGIRNHNVKLNKDLISFRNQIDSDRALSTIENVSKGIRNKIFYPRETFMCSSCSYRNICRSWKEEQQ